MTADRKPALDRLIEDSIQDVPGRGQVLWVNRLHFYKKDLLVHYGPTLKDVQTNLDVYCAYARHTPQIYETQELLDLAHDNQPNVDLALKRFKRATDARYFEVYFALFGLRRVTFAQLSEVAQYMRRQGTKVPSRMSWHFRFDGFSNFYPALLEYLIQKDQAQEAQDEQDEVTRSFDEMQSQENDQGLDLTATYQY